MKSVGFFLILIFLCGGVFGVKGVSPGSHEVDYEPGLNREFVFDFVLDGEESVFVEGDLSEYVEVDKVLISGKERVEVSLSFPESVDFFGVSEIWIVAGNVRGLIKVRVPYPDRFVELGLGVLNIEEGESGEVNLRVFNLGKEDLFVNPIVEVYSGSEVVEIFNLESSYLGVEWILDLELSLDEKKYVSGDYLVVAFVDYDGEVARAERVFRVGEFNLRILDYTKEVFGDVERFEVEVESLSNSLMNEVFAEVRVVGSEDKGFDSSIVSLGPWEKKRLTGFFDSSGLVGEVGIKVDIHFDDEVLSEVFFIHAIDSSDFLFWALGILIFLLVCFWIFFIKRKFGERFKIIKVVF